MMQRHTMTAKPFPDPAVIASNIRLEAMLGEMNHRVANSLQLVAAMVSLEARTIADPAAREALQATQRRIDAVAQVHSRLYRSLGAADIDLAAYLTDLAGQLHDSYSTDRVDRPIQVEAATVRVPVDRAISIGDRQRARQQCLQICLWRAGAGWRFYYIVDQPGRQLSACRRGSRHRTPRRWPSARHWHGASADRTDGAEPGRNRRL